MEGILKQSKEKMEKEEGNWKKEMLVGSLCNEKERKNN
jgi:hypothetical protein